MKILLGAPLATDLLAELQATHPDAECIIAATPEQVLAELPGSDIVFSRGFTDKMMAAADSIKFLQIPYAGMDRLPLAELDSRGVKLANARIHGETIAELVMGMMLSLSRSFVEIHDNQRKHQWVRMPQKLLMDSTLALIGVGTIGNEIAKRAQAFGMKTLGFTRSGRSTGYLDEAYTTSDLMQHIGKADYVVVACPLTPETLKLVNAQVFAAMKPTSYILNIGRGPIIDETAMIEALNSNQIAGAGLDVFEVEPLPETSPLWDMPNVLCFPHLAGNHEGSEQRAGRIFVDNVLRFVEGKPLRCEVDLKLGY